MDKPTGKERHDKAMLYHSIIGEAPSRSDGIPVKVGQLWEPCSCGEEPVYMPLFLCDRCWPKAREGGSR